MATQQRGPINGLDPLIYTGGLPNLVIMQREPTPKDYQEFVLGHWWIIPVEYSDTGTGEVWVLVSKRYGLATWKRLHGGGITPPTQSIVIGNRYFTTPGSGTYTPTVGMLQCFVECVGAGGGAGGGSSATGQLCFAGGAGGYSAKLFTAAQIGVSQSFVIGTGGAVGSTGSTGGNSTFGSILTSNGGVGGVFNPNTASTPNGIGGTATGGDINIQGGNGSMSTWTTSNLFSGQGGNSFFAPGGAISYVSSAGTANGNNGLYGSGGGPLYYAGGGTHAIAGGVGGNGFIKVTEYFA